MIRIEKKGKLSTVKTGKILCGFDAETDDPIIINGKTRAYLDSSLNKAEAQLKKEHRLPTTLLKHAQMSEEYKELYNLNSKSSPDNTMIVIYDKTDPKFAETFKGKEKLNMAIKLVSFLDLNKANKRPDGTEITGWNEFGIKKDDYLGMARYLISYEGIGMNEETLAIALKDKDYIGLGIETQGEAEYQKMLRKYGIKEDDSNESEANS